MNLLQAVQTLDLANIRRILENDSPSLSLKLDALQKALMPDDPETLSLDPTQALRRAHETERLLLTHIPVASLKEEELSFLFERMIPTLMEGLDIDSDEELAYAVERLEAWVSWAGLEGIRSVSLSLSEAWWHLVEEHDGGSECVGKLVQQGAQMLLNHGLDAQTFLKFRIVDLDSTNELTQMGEAFARKARVIEAHPGSRPARSRM